MPKVNHSPYNDCCDTFDVNYFCKKLHLRCDCVLNMLLLCECKTASSFKRFCVIVNAGHVFIPFGEKKPPSCGLL